MDDLTSELTNFRRFPHPRRRRRAHPLAGPAKRCSLVPTTVAAALARDRKHAGLLRALGQSIPRKWAAAEQKEALAEEHCIDFNVEAVLQDTEDCDELFQQALAEEICTTYVAHADVLEDDHTSRGYALKKPSKALASDLEEYRRRRTAVINRFRKVDGVLWGGQGASGTGCWRPALSFPVT